MKKSGASGSASMKAIANKAMAARMKREGIERGTMRCPICHEIIGRSNAYMHIVKAKCA